ncbi:hypothetical protein PR048_025392 [Dryococelus australis]|uniref:Uncharacterized protein n=1 Tax=Dryococelus australis TaxID=614101 RepID=A0ABQ9GR59_9NEOP|nr:hypothetical protein PR048_025392 [Dryococelus australis]
MRASGEKHFDVTTHATWKGVRRSSRPLSTCTNRNAELQQFVRLGDLKGIRDVSYLQRLEMNCDENWERRNETRATGEVRAVAEETRSIHSSGPEKWNWSEKIDSHCSRSEWDPRPPEIPTAVMRTARLGTLDWSRGHARAVAETTLAPDGRECHETNSRVGSNRFTVQLKAVHDKQATRDVYLGRHHMEIDAGRRSALPSNRRRITLWEEYGETLDPRSAYILPALAAMDLNWRLGAPAELKYEKEDIHDPDKPTGRKAYPQRGSNWAIVEVSALKKKEVDNRFIGLCNWLRDFIPNVAYHVGPLYDLLKKTHDWRCTEDERATFETLNELLEKPEMFHRQQPRNPLAIQTEVRGWEIGERNTLLPLLTSPAVTAWNALASWFILSRQPRQRHSAVGPVAWHTYALAIRTLSQSLNSPTKCSTNKEQRRTHTGPPVLIQPHRYWLFTVNRALVKPLHLCGHCVFVRNTSGSDRSKEVTFGGSWRIAVKPRFKKISSLDTIVYIYSKKQIGVAISLILACPFSNWLREALDVDGVSDWLLRGAIRTPVCWTAYALLDPVYLDTKKLGSDMVDTARRASSGTSPLILAERLSCSPPTKANRVQPPGRVTSGFSHVRFVLDDAAAQTALEAFTGQITTERMPREGERRTPENSKRKSLSERARDVTAILIFALLVYGGVEKGKKGGRGETKAAPDFCTFRCRNLEWSRSCSLVGVFFLNIPAFAICSLLAVYAYVTTDGVRRKKNGTPSIPHVPKPLAYGGRTRGKARLIIFGASSNREFQNSRQAHGGNINIIIRCRGQSSREVLKHASVPKMRISLQENVRWESCLRVLPAVDWTRASS